MIYGKDEICDRIWQLNIDGRCGVGKQQARCGEVQQEEKAAYAP
jgi:hypothetical protein